MTALSDSFRSAAKYHTRNRDVLLENLRYILHRWKVVDRDRESITFAKQFRGGVVVYCKIQYKPKSTYALWLSEDMLYDHVEDRYGTSAAVEAMELILDPITGPLRFTDREGFNLLKARTDAKKLEKKAIGLGKETLAAIRVLARNW